MQAKGLSFAYHVQRIEETDVYIFFSLRLVISKFEFTICSLYMTPVR